MRPFLAPLNEASRKAFLPDTPKRSGGPIRLARMARSCCDSRACSSSPRAMKPGVCRPTSMGALKMKLYVTYGSPYARLARIIVIEKALESRVEIIEAKTRTPGSPYYRINPSGRVPYLVDDNGVGMEDSQLICAYLDGLDGTPRFHNPSRTSDWA